MVSTVTILFDSVRITYNPFYPHNKRMREYYLVFFIVTVVLVCIQHFDDWETSNSYEMLMIMSFICSIAVLSLLVTLEYFQRKQKTDEDIKRQIRWRYYISSLAFLIMQALL
jgi:RsiW-degrading membrane proteinase PrsW (M82 family)